MPTMMPEAQYTSKQYSSSSSFSFPLPPSRPSSRSPDKPSCPSSPLTPPSELPHHRKPGSFHHTKSNLAQYCKLPNNGQDRYELVNGVLYSRPPMPDVEHANIQRVLAAFLGNLNMNPPPNCQRIYVYQEATIEIVLANQSPLLHGQTPAKESSLVADIAVGLYRSQQEIAALLDKQYGIIFPSQRDPPSLVIEITSKNRANDLLNKTALYARAGIPNYVIVDREEQCVIVYKLEEDPTDVGGTTARKSKRPAAPIKPIPPRYNFRRNYCGDQIVETPFLDQLKLTAKDILRPGRTAEDILGSPVLKARKETEEVRRQKEEAEAREEEERRQKEEEGRQKEEARTLLRRCQEVLQEQGLKVPGQSDEQTEARNASEGMSSSRSPPTKKARPNNY